MNFAARCFRWRLLATTSEQEVLPRVVRRIGAVLDKAGGVAEVALVDDGSRDRNWERMAATRRTPNFSFCKQFVLSVCIWKRGMDWIFMKIAQEGVLFIIFSAEVSLEGATTIERSSK